MKIAISAALLLTALLTAAILLAPGYVRSRPLPHTPEIRLSPEAAPADADRSAISPSDPEEEPPLITTVTFTFVGDCMLATDRGGEYKGSFNALANTVEPSYFLENFADLFADDDWTIANLENVFTDNTSLPVRNKGYTPAYWYRSQTANTAILTEGSVEIVSLANNHATDYGNRGFADTCAALDEAGILWGDNDHMLLLEKEGFTVALYCTTFYYTGYDRIIAQKIGEVEADYKIVYFHGGTERTHIPDAWKAAGCRRLIDAGADLVIGHHPHVLQPIEVYNGKTIIHSLGNFVFGGSRSEENRTIVYRHRLTLTDGVLTDIGEEIIPCYLYSDAYKPAIITDEGEIEAVRTFLRGESASPLVK